MTYELIYTLLMSYLPAIAAVLTCLLTFVKLISAIKANKADNSELSKQLTEMQSTCKIMANENAKMAVENANLKKTVMKVLDKTDTEI